MYKKVINNCRFIQKGDLLVLDNKNLVPVDVISRANDTIYLYTNGNRKQPYIFGAFETVEYYRFEIIVN